MNFTKKVKWIKKYMKEKQCSLQCALDAWRRIYGHLDKAPPKIQDAMAKLVKSNPILRECVGYIPSSGSKMTICLDYVEVLARIREKIGNPKNTYYIIGELWR